MKRIDGVVRWIFVTGAAVILASLIGPAASPACATEADATEASNAQPLNAGEVIPFLSLPEDDRPEGIAVGPSGNIFVGNREFAADGTRTSSILRIDRSGAVAVFAVLETAGDPETEGLLGLAVGPEGTIYAAVASFDPSTHGVWRIRPDGSGMSRLRESVDIIFPNGITLDSNGNLYVTDSIAGAVWKFDQQGRAVATDGGNGWWIQDPLLEAGPDLGLGIPPIGANGIAFVSPCTLFVANTRQGSIVQVPVTRSGSAGPPEIVAQDLLLLTVDGIAVDVHGHVHAVIAGFQVIPDTHPLVHVDPGTGAIARGSTDDDAFHFPVGIAFARGGYDRKSVFVVNGGALLSVPGPGPGVVQVRVSEPGLP